MAIVRFGDVVRRANTKEDKDNTDLEFYVGGEHIDSGEIQVTKRGIIKGSTIGPMFYFGFKAGQVLIVSRNPHLKKAGMVKFDGICSEKTFVVESSDESVLLQEYLPFIVQSDDFWKFAEENKSGSVNYFVNWTTFARYEFDLPSLEEQKRLAEVLWAAEDEKQAILRAIEKAKVYKNALLHSLFKSDGEKVKIDYYCTLVKQKYTGEHTGVNAIELECIEQGTGQLLKINDSITGRSGYTLFQPGDVLFGKLRPYLKKYHLSSFEGICCNEIWAIRAKETTTSKFIYYILSSEDFVNFNNNQSFGTKMPRSSWKIASQFECPLVSMDEQSLFVQNAEKIDETILNLRNVIDSLNDFIRVKFNTLAGGGALNVQ